MEERCITNDLAHDSADSSDPLAKLGRLAQLREAADRLGELERMEDEILERVLANRASADCNCSVYIGGPGIAFMLLKLAAMRGDRGLLGEAASFLDHWEDQCTEQAAAVPGFGLSLLCGRAGWLCVDALRRYVAGDARGAAAAAQAYAALAAIPGERMMDADEWLYGRAGYLQGCFVLRDVLGDDAVPDHVVANVAEEMLSNGLEYAQSVGFEAPLLWQWQGSEYIGAAHGLMGMTFALLHVPGVMNTSATRQHVEDTLSWLALQMTADGNWPVVRGSPAHLVHFCHGAPGAVLLFCKAFEVLGDRRWLDVAQKAGHCIWEFGLLKKGPGLCHGVSGNGYAFLALYRATHEESWLLRAQHFAFRMLQPETAAQSRTPDHPLSLFEGAAGAACFLADLRLRPAAAAFPLFEVGGFR